MHTFMNYNAVMQQCIVTVSEIEIVLNMIYISWKHFVFQLAPLQVLINKYCIQTKTDPANCHLQFDGEDVRPQDTPMDLDIEDGDCLDIIETMWGDSTAAAVWEVTRKWTCVVSSELASQTEVWIISITSFMINYCVLYYNALYKQIWACDHFHIIFEAIKSYLFNLACLDWRPLNIIFTVLWQFHTFSFYNNLMNMNCMFFK
jgi:hypothetical protein